MVASFNKAADAEYYHREAGNALRSSYYYGGAAEPAGQWYAPAGDFGLVDGTPVDPVDFQNFYAGFSLDGLPLIALTRNRGADRVPAYDLTMSTPRSLSLVWALAGESLKAEIEQAQERAVRAALVMVEREAVFARRGRAGSVAEAVPLSAALFRHSESRPAEHPDGRFFGDPNLHTHAVVFNMATRADGTVGAIYSIALRDWKMAIGAAYHAALASEMQALGFGIDRLGDNGTFELVGVNDALIGYFSARRNEIKEELARHGVTSADAPALAAAIAKATRSAKVTQGSDEREAAWADAATALGVDVTGFAESVRQYGRVRDLETGEHHLAERLAVLPALLTQDQSVFDRKDLLRWVASALVGTGLPASRIEIEARRLLEAGQIVEIGKDRLNRSRYSTQEMLRIEREVVAYATELAQRTGFAVDHEKLIADSERLGLTEEQSEAALAMVREAAIAVVSGAPGSGKSTTLTPVVSAYRAENRRVLGAAAAWRTANTLSEELSVPARAIASWLERSRCGHGFLEAGDVLIVDEAGLVNARDMHALLGEVERAGAKIILVGDPRQLQAIGGPGLDLVQRAIDGARIETILRQHAQWQRDAVRAFGDGGADEALEAFAAHDCVIEADGAQSAVATVVAQWKSARAGDPTHEPLLLARTNAAVAAISRAVREELRAEGVITGPEVTFATATPSGQTTSIALARGDRIRFQVRNDELGVINGSAGTVIAIRQQDAAIRIEAEIAGRRIEFSPDDLADSKGRARLGWAYATSVFQSQGLTVERAVVLIDPDFDRHQIYVAASRSRGPTTFVFDSRAIDRRLTAELPLDRQSTTPSFAAGQRRTWLSQRLARAHVKETTLDVIEADRERARPKHPSSDAAGERRRVRQRSREASLG